MRRLFRVTLLVIAAIFVVAAPNAFAVDSCYRCEAIIYEDGGIDYMCNTPPRGQWGARFCEVDEVSPGWWYCQTWGNLCCIDPRM